MNKLLTKTVRKGLLMTVVMAIVLAASIVVTALFGVNYAPTAQNSKTLTVTVNTFFYETKLEEVESVCENKFNELKLNAEYEQKGKMSGDDCEIIYYFAEDTDLSKAKEELSKAFADKISSEEGWGNAFITVASGSETLATNIPVSYFVRAAIAVAVISVLALVYVAVRYKSYMGLVAGACALLGGVMTAAIVLLTRIPFTGSSLQPIVLASIVSAVIAMLSFNNLRANMRAENAKDKTAEELVIQSSACKETLCLAVLLGGAILLTGVIATTAASWFAVVAIVALAVSLFIGYVFAPAMTLALKEKADKKAAEKKSGYVGAKKTSMQKAREEKAEQTQE